MSEIESRDNFEERFRKHLPRSNDLVLITLKGHLLMEEQINCLLDVFLPNPRALDPARPNLFLRLRLVRALLDAGNVDRFLDAAEALNTLRNRFAHHLDHPQIEAYITGFLRLLEGPEEITEFEKEPTARRLKRCIAALCGVLYGFGRGWAAGRSAKRGDEF
jgi:hypothetical protein